MNIDLQIQRNHSFRILGLVFRYARLKSGLSLRDLGELANISHTLIANIERGKIAPNSETMKELFSILHIHYRDDDEIIQQFTTIYNHVLYNLYMFQYDEVKEEMAQLIQDEELYLNSIVLVDYSLLRFLYAVLLDDVSNYLRTNMDLLKRVSSLLSDRQQQLKHFIFGIDYYNQGLYHDSYLELEQAIKIGEPEMDPFIYLYMVKTQVKMFIFMDAQKLGERAIKMFEEDLNYYRAMQVRIALGISQNEVRKFDSAKEYLNKVIAFGKQYRLQYFVDQGYTEMAIGHMMLGQVEEAKEVVSLVQETNSKVLFIRMFIAYQEGETKLVYDCYNEYRKSFESPHRKRERAFMDVIVKEYKAVDYTESEYMTSLETLLDIATKGYDQEMLNHVYTSLIGFYRSKRMYKKALELSEKARDIRSYGLFNV